MEDVVQLFDKVDQNREAMVDTWKLLVDRDCGSGNKAGVDGVGRDVKDFLEKCGFKVWFHEYEKAGNMLVAEYGDASKPFIVLTGHMDTVFGDGTAAARPFTIKDGKVTGYQESYEPVLPQHFFRLPDYCLHGHLRRPLRRGTGQRPFSR